MFNYRYWRHQMYEQHMCNYVAETRLYWWNFAIFKKFYIKDVIWHLTFHMWVQTYIWSLQSETAILLVMRVKEATLNRCVASKRWTAGVATGRRHCCTASWEKKSDWTRCRLHRHPYQDAAAAHRRFRSQQVLPDKVDQRGGGDLKAVRIGSIREWREGLSRFQGQDLRQRNLLAGPEKNRRTFRRTQYFCWV